MDFTIIAHAVEVDHGVKRLSMRFIKRYAAPERARLSVELCEQITQAFDGLGLFTIPQQLPTNENDFVFVIKKDSPLGEAVAIASQVARMERMGEPVLRHFLDRFPTAVQNLT